MGETGATAAAIGPHRIDGDASSLKCGDPLTIRSEGRDEAPFRWFRREAAEKPWTGSAFTVGGIYPDTFSRKRSTEFMVENLPLKTLTFQDLTIEGYSRAAVQSYWRIPELKIGFDMGGSPWSFMGTQTFFITHAHLDHLAALPAYVARRRMMKMPPPTIYIPAEVKEAVERMLRAWQRLDRGRMLCELIPAEAGAEYELSREHIVTTFPTTHTVPSLGYLVWERRKKLKPEYQGLTGDQIRDLRLAGNDVSAEVRVPIVAYTGDTAPAGLDACPAVYESKVLITETTFFRPEHRKEKIHKFGHIHLDDILARADRFQNQLLILAHFSTRYHDDQIRKSIWKKLPESLRERVELWL